jgi:hypothetical protein
MLNKQERTLGIVAGVVGAGYLCWLWAVSPLLASYNYYKAETLKLQDTLKANNAILAKAKEADAKFIAFRKEGLSNDASAAQLRFVEQIHVWATNASLAPPALKPQNRAGDTKFGLSEITVHVAARGNMRTIGAFLNNIRTSLTPVRISQLMINERVAQQDDLAMEVDLSTLWEDPNAKTNAKTTAVKRTNP